MANAGDVTYRGVTAPDVDRYILERTAGLGINHLHFETHWNTRLMFGQVSADLLAADI